jgi:hypothetical protein
MCSKAEFFSLYQNAPHPGLTSDEHFAQFRMRSRVAYRNQGGIWWRGQFVLDETHNPIRTGFDNSTARNSTRIGNHQMNRPDAIL